MAALKARKYCSKYPMLTRIWYHRIETRERDDDENGWTRSGESRTKRARGLHTLTKALLSLSLSHLLSSGRKLLRTTRPWLCTMLRAWIATANTTSKGNGRAARLRLKEMCDSLSFFLRENKNSSISEHLIYSFSFLQCPFILQIQTSRQLLFHVVWAENSEWRMCHKVHQEHPCRIRPLLIDWFVTDIKVARIPYRIGLPTLDASRGGPYSRWMTRPGLDTPTPTKRQAAAPSLFKRKLTNSPWQQRTHGQEPREMKGKTCSPFLVARVTSFKNNW